MLDTERTLPFIPNFTEEDQVHTNNVLSAYSNKDEVMGYSQGMNYVVATIIKTGMKEENAFWLLMRLMKGFSLERIYPSEYSVINECFVKYDKLMQLYCPAAYNHLTFTLKISPSFYVQQWFQTIFLYSQRIDLTLRVLDLMMIRKIEALFSVSIAIIQLSESTILNYKQTLDAISFLKALNPELLPTDDIIKRANSFPDLLKQLADLERQSQLLDDPTDACSLM